MYEYSIDPFRNLEEVLQAHGSRLTNQKSDSLTAQCPAHDDQEPSLSVKRCPDGRVLVHCFAGCTSEDVCRALGIEMCELFPRTTTRETSDRHSAKVKRSTGDSDAQLTPCNSECAELPYPCSVRSEGSNTVYTYLNAEGQIAYESVRIPKANGGKTFRQRRYDRDDNLGWGLGDNPQIPYGLPELLAHPDNVVHVTEGEKDTVTLRERKLLAVSITDGALKHPELKQWFRGRHIVIHADNDEAGLGKALKRAEALYPFVATIRIIGYPELPNKGDVTEYLDDGYGSTTDLLARCNSAQTWHPKSASLAAALKIRKASEITPRSIDWLWERWLPSGMVTLFAGYGGSGKSTTALAIAAALTNGGSLPDGSSAPLTNVLILAAEDSPEHTLVPRLIELGADLDRIRFVDGVLHGDEMPGWIQLREHIAPIEATVRDHNIGLIIIDPVSSYIGDGNSDRESDVRSALMPVVQMAERTGVAVLMIRHVSKGGDSNRAASRILGSTAWHDVPRVAWMLADAPGSVQPELNEDGTRDVTRVLGVVKSNLTTKPPSLWGIQPADGRFHWLPEPSPVTIDDCFRQPSRDNTFKVDEAVEWLRQELAGGMQPTRSVEAAAHEAGISKRTLERARPILNVSKRKDKDGWWIGLPPALTTPDQDRQDRHTGSTDAKVGIAEDEKQIRHLSSYGVGGGDDESTNTTKLAELAIFPKPCGESDESEPGSIMTQDRQPKPDSFNAANFKTANASGAETVHTDTESVETGEWSITL